MDNLRMLTVDEVAELLHTSLTTLSYLRETGALKAIKTGKAHMYSQEAVRKFQLTYEGYDMDNLVNINASVEAVKSKQLGKLGAWAPFLLVVIICKKTENKKINM